MTDDACGAAWPYAETAKARIVAVAAIVLRMFKLLRGEHCCSRSREQRCVKFI
jgi:hypothetical protein